MVGNWKMKIWYQINTNQPHPIPNIGFRTGNSYGTEGHSQAQSTRPLSALALRALAQLGAHTGTSTCHWSLIGALWFHMFLCFFLEWEERPTSWSKWGNSHELHQNIPLYQNKPHDLQNATLATPPAVFWSLGHTQLFPTDPKHHRPSTGGGKKLEDAGSML